MKILDHIYSMKDNRIIPYTIVGKKVITYLDNVKNIESDTYDYQEITNTIYTCEEGHLSKDDLCNHKLSHDTTEIHNSLCFSSIEDLIEELKSDFE